MTIRSAWLETLGCQMNEADSEKMAGILRAEGYRMAAAPEEADVILINTCSIRDRAEFLWAFIMALAERFGRRILHPNLFRVINFGCGAALMIFGITLAGQMLS